MTCARRRSKPRSREIGRALYAAAARSRPALFRARGLRGALLAQALRDEQLRRALFQFVDVLPQLDDAAAVARHFQRLSRRPRAAGPVGPAAQRSATSPLMAWAVRASVTRIARLFLVEENRAALGRVAARGRAPRARRRRSTPSAKRCSPKPKRSATSQRYRDVLAWQQAAGTAPHASIKLSGLTPRFDPLDPGGSRARVLERIAPLMQRRRRAGAALTDRHGALRAEAAHPRDFPRARRSVSRPALAAGNRAPGLSARDRARPRRARRSGRAAAAGASRCGW